MNAADPKPDNLVTVTVRVPKRILDEAAAESVRRTTEAIPVSLSSVLREWLVAGEASR